MHALFGKVYANKLLEQKLAEPQNSAVSTDNFDPTQLKGRKLKMVYSIPQPKDVMLTGKNGATTISQKITFATDFSNPGVGEVYVKSKKDWWSLFLNEEDGIEFLWQIAGIGCQWQEEKTLGKQQFRSWSLLYGVGVT